ncbi:MAG TPA: PPOX class F420-dependent oxidoreductase [Solirubrobacteraceae bacterium]|nr:PPOX class F420-dependent oxidoreductase [Solirubrobacteraceae bacterium]
MLIPDRARDLIESDALAHLVTLEADGRPQVSCVWVGLEDGDIVFASLGGRRKLDNIRRDPRVSLSIEGTATNEIGLREYLVVHGTARIEQGGGPELLQRLAYTYIGPDAKFPPMDDPPPGVVVHITPERLGGVGPWH